MSDSIDINSESAKELMGGRKPRFAKIMCHAGGSGEENPVEGYTRFVPQPEAPRESRGDEEAAEKSALNFRKGCYLIPKDGWFRSGFMAGCAHVRSQQKPEACPSAEEAAETVHDVSGECLKAFHQCAIDDAIMLTAQRSFARGYARAKTELEEARKRILELNKITNKLKWIEDNQNKEILKLYGELGSAHSKTVPLEIERDALKFQLAERDKKLRIEYDDKCRIQAMVNSLEESEYFLKAQLSAANSKLEIASQIGRALVEVLEDREASVSDFHQYTNDIYELAKLSPAEPTKDEQKGVGNGKEN